MKNNKKLDSLVIAYEDFLKKYNWTVDGTLTTPFRISSNAIGNAVSRVEKYLTKAGYMYRFFAVSEPFNEGGYHLHFIGCIEGLNSTDTIKVIEKSWQKSIGLSRRPINKCKKHSNEWIKYILKNMKYNKINYYLNGNNWKEIS